jgi:glycosyltransferase involved in cell wall biosynthesis
MSNELVSIIMPAYNSADTISTSILSATNQSYKNIELIVVNDGSTDKTADICQSFVEKDMRIKFLSQSNGGVSSARNTGIRMAKGEFIAFLDADDLWEQDKIEQQVMASRNQPEAIILTQLQRFSEDCSSRTLLSKSLPPQYLSKNDYLRTLLNLENHEMASFGTSLVRKAHLEASGLFDENLVTAEDWDLWLRLAFYFPFVNIDQPLRLYRKYTGSLTTRTKLEKTLQGQLYIIDKVAQVGVLFPSEIRTAKIRKYLEFANIYKYQNMRFAAIQAVSKAFAFSPAGCGKLFLKKLIKKTCRILRGLMDGK